MKKRCKNTDCPYWADRIEVPYAGTLDPGPDIMIVGESPGLEEEREQKPFIGASGRVLQALLEANNLHRGLVFIANSARCRINVEADDLKVIGTALKCCRPNLDTVIKKVKPKVIVALGNIALRQLVKKQAITKNRGRFFDSEWGVPVLATFHPAYVLRGKSKGFPNIPLSAMNMRERLLFEDFAQAVKKVEGEAPAETSLDTSPPPEGRYLSFDYETNGLDTTDPGIRIISFSASTVPGKSTAQVVHEGEPLPSWFVDRLTDPTIQKIVAARPFEERFSLKHGVKIAGPIHDVLVMAHVLDENGHGYDLETLCDTYTEKKKIKDIIGGGKARATLEDLPEEKLVAYNAVDSDATLRLFLELRGRLMKSPMLLRYYLKFIQPTLDMLADTWHSGIKIDAEMLRKSEEELATLSDEITQVLTDMTHPEIRAKFADNFKFSRKAIIQDILFKHKRGFKLKPSKEHLTPKTGEPSTAEKHLSLFKDNAFCKEYLRLVTAQKFQATYVRKLWQFIRADGRVHPNTLLNATTTGRSVILAPTIQTIPQRGPLAHLVKRCYVADEGWTMGARDLAQSEIRIIAWLANDRVMLDAINAGIDIHTKTAAVVNNVPLEKVTKDMRQKAKGVNFGFIYGMSARKFKDYALHSYGVSFTDEEAEMTRERFFAKPDGYHQLLVFHAKQRFLVRKNGYVWSPLGRHRRLPEVYSEEFMKQGEAERQAINFPVQSFSSDLGFIGMFLFNQAIKQRGLESSIKILAFIHDAIIFQAKDEVFTEAMLILKDCMESRSAQYVKDNFGFEIGYKIGSDGKSGKNWADLKDWKEAA